MKREYFKVNGKDLLNKIKEIIHEGNARRIIIADKNGKELAHCSLTAGVVGALLLPFFAVVAAVALLVTECTIIVEKDEPETVVE